MLGATTAAHVAGENTLRRIAEYSRADPWQKVMASVAHNGAGGKDQDGRLQSDEVVDRGPSRGQGCLTAPFVPEFDKTFQGQPPFLGLPSLDSYPIQGPTTIQEGSLRTLRSDPLLQRF